MWNVVVLSYILIYVIYMIALYCKVNENKNMFWSAISDFYCGSFLVYDTTNKVQIYSCINLDLQLHILNL